MKTNGAADGRPTRRRKWPWRFFPDDKATTSTEYAAILAVVIITVIVSISLLGGKVESTLTNVDGNLTVAVGGDDDG